MAPNVGLEHPNIGPEKEIKSSGQGAGCSFLVLKPLRWAGAQQHTQAWLPAAACRLGLAANAMHQCQALS